MNLGKRRQKKEKFRRVEAASDVGLTPEQVQMRMAAGATNVVSSGITPSVGKIIRQNIMTPFNLINLFLVVAVVLVGAPMEGMFFGVAIINTLMGIFQELRAKKTLDKLSVLARGKAIVVRDGKQISIEQEDVVIDDILILESGKQVVADAVIVSAEGLEIDESLLTGESQAIRKKAGDEVLSGSFVLAGRAHVRITAVGDESYAGKLSAEAKKTKKATAPLMNTLNNIIRILAIVIIPIGGLLFYRQYTGSGELQASVLGSTAAMVGMIPEGLILLTGVTLTLGALKLARRKALVQALPSIETLARVDVLCLDKTGTITDGTLGFEEVIPDKNFTKKDISKVLGEMMLAINDDNSTARALRENFKSGSGWTSVTITPFSSRRKWSAAQFVEHGSYVVGAPDFVFPDKKPTFLTKAEKHTKKGQRVLCLAHSSKSLVGDDLPKDLKVMGLIILSDRIRPEAKKTFRFFRNEGVALKVISGDDAQTVSIIAEKAGIAGARNYIDLGKVKADADFGELVQKYTVFGRVSPEQKKALVIALKKAGRTVCMTGDGVNDVLALKEADCGVAMITGSDAARASADFVLMTGDFSAMIEVLKEGRRVINNIENVASLYLVKTIYSTVLSLIYSFAPYPYPFTPLQMTPINALTVGIPSFFLAFRQLYDKPRGRFLVNVLENAAPAALTVVFNIMIIQLAGFFFELSQDEMSTMNVFLTATVGFSLLARVARPLRWLERLLIGLMMSAFLVCMIWFGWFFGYETLFSRNMFFYLPLLIISPQVFNFMSDRVHRVIEWRDARQTLKLKKSKR